MLADELEELVWGDDALRVEQQNVDEFLEEMAAVFLELEVREDVGAQTVKHGDLVFDFSVLLEDRQVIVKVLGVVQDGLVLFLDSRLVIYLNPLVVFGRVVFPVDLDFGVLFVAKDVLDFVECLW